jgi:hypothetical protein
VATAHERLTDRLLGPLLPARECGGCTACCFGLEVAGDGWTKPPDTACAHCLADGCAIYAERPEPCRTFHCAWRRIAALPEALRPDRSEIIVLLEIDPQAADPFKRLCFVLRWLDPEATADWAHLPPPMRALFERSTYPVWFSIAGTRGRTLARPSAEIYRHIVEGAPLPNKETETARWRAQLPPRIPGGIEA